MTFDALMHQEEFKRKARTKLGNKRKLLFNNEDELARNAKTFDAARTRHAGVLGMCAFVQAHPYDVPTYVPPIFECLSSHLNDPEPIPVSPPRCILQYLSRYLCVKWV